MTAFNYDGTDPKINAPAVSVGTGKAIEQLENILRPLGLERVKGLAAANFEGTVKGRRVRVCCAMRSRHQYLGIGNASYRTFQGWMLTLTVDSDFGTRLVLSTKPPAAWTGPLLAWRKLRPVPDLPDNFVAHANEPDWVRGFIGEAALEPIRRLFTDEIVADRSLGVGPFNATLTLGVSSIPDVGEKLGGWIQDCVELAVLAESHPPSHIVKPTYMERLSEEDPKKATLITVLSLLFGIPLVLFALILLSGTVLLFVGGPKLLAIAAICFVAIFMPLAMGFLLWRILSGGRS